MIFLNVIIKDRIISIIIPENSKTARKKMSKIRVKIVKITKIILENF